MDNCNKSPSSPTCTGHRRDGGFVHFYRLVKVGCIVNIPDSPFFARKRRLTKTGI